MKLEVTFDELSIIIALLMITILSVARYKASEYYECKD